MSWNYMTPPESFYNHIPIDVVHIPKPRRYVSQYRPAVVHETKSSRVPMKTMGPAKVELPTPDKYLKKHSRQPVLPKNKPCADVWHSNCTQRKPVVPSRTDKPLMGLHTKGFIRPDTPVLKVPKPASVDTKKGHKQLLEDSGLIPKYIKKKDYGEVPRYIQRRRKEEQRVSDKLEEMMKEKKEQDAKKYMPDEDRQAVLEGLKKNRNEVLREFLGLPFVSDTMSKSSRRKRIEVTLKQLDNDIKLFEKFQVKLIIQ